MRSIRNAIKGDCIRLNGFTDNNKTSSFDMSDPRNRAKSHMDVTVLQTTTSIQNADKITLLAKVHALSSTISLPNMVAIPQGNLAWISFSFETARRLGLQAESSLRIYNPVAFRVQDCWMVACTQLCDVRSKS
jgi:hypothetical protein